MTHKSRAPIDRVSVTFFRVVCRNVMTSGSLNEVRLPFRTASGIVQSHTLQCCPIMPSNKSRHAVLAGYLGWTLDAFDFFVIVFMFDVLAAQFGVPKSKV